MENKHKAQIRIPTKEQYAYIELSVEDTIDNIVEIYNRATLLINKSGGGLDANRWREVLDDYLFDEQISVDDYEQMDLEQKNIIQEIKKAKKRKA